MAWKEYLFPFCMVRGWAVSLIYFNVGLSLTNIEAWRDIRILDLQIRGRLGSWSLVGAVRLSQWSCVNYLEGERKVVCNFPFAIHIEATRMALLTFVSVVRR